MSTAAGGTNPADMPIAQSSRFYMAVNLKTAASLGVSLSDVLVARANEVRECNAASSCRAARR
jgi:putative ABC transport system substrate-binding protein